jgi:hypothetical protein
MTTAEMPDAKLLSHVNLHEVFAQRDPDKRWAAIERTYVEDVRLIESQGEVVGRQALNDRARQILDDVGPDFVLEEDGLEYVGPDTVARPWRFGPPGSPVVRGLTILMVRDGRVSVVRELVGS